MSALMRSCASRSVAGHWADHKYIMDNQPLKEALTALTDALAKRPAEEILFQWFRSGRLVGELSVLMKHRHPEVQVEIDRPKVPHNRTPVLVRDPRCSPRTSLTNCR